jgi:hypothetical protein
MTSDLNDLIIIFPIVDVKKLVKNVYIIENLVQISLKQPNIFSKK